MKKFFMLCIVFLIIFLSIGPAGFGRAADDPTADLAISIAAVTPWVKLDEPFLLTLTAANNGPAQADDVQVTGALQEGLVLVSLETSQGSCSGLSQITCELGELASTAGATISMTLTTSLAGYYTQTANIGSAVTDPIPTNNTTSISLRADIPEVYVVFAIDTEADNGHPLTDLHPTLDLSSYERMTCPEYLTKRSFGGINWTTYTDGTVFNFTATPEGALEPGTAFTCGSSTHYGGLLDYYRAVAFTVPADGIYDIQVQLAYTGSPPDTEIYVAGEAGGNPDPSNKLSSYIARVGDFTSGDYVTISDNLSLSANQTYWWVASKQSGGDALNQFSVYRGLSGEYANTTMGQIMNPAFRAATLDSYGQPFKMSWFMEMDDFINNSLSANGEPMDYLTLYNELLSNWGSEVETYGDEIAYHHHFMTWSGTDWLKTGHQHANDGLYDAHNDALDRMILEADFYPANFRAGWLNNHNQLQAWEEKWIFTDAGGRGWADAGWEPYHPSELDFHQAGEMDHWIANCPGLPDPEDVEQAFAQALDHSGPVFYCVYAHQMDNMRGYVEDLQVYLQAAAAENPGVNYHFATALETMQRYIYAADTTAPQLNITSSGAGLFTISSDEPLWGNGPYVTAKFGPGSFAVFEHYTATLTPVTNMWTVEIPAENRGQSLIELGAGALDSYGNSGVAHWSVENPVLAARKDGEVVLIEWETTNELEIVEFNLYRSSTPEWAQAGILNPEPIEALTPGSPTGNSYLYIDNTIETGVMYYYWLEVLHSDSTNTVIGPVVIWGYQLYLPVASR